MKVLLAVDGSTYTKKMLAYLTTHEELIAGEAEFTVLTVMPALPPRARAAVGRGPSAGSSPSVCPSCVSSKRRR